MSFRNAEIPSISLFKACKANLASRAEMLVGIGVCAAIGFCAAGLGRWAWLQAHGLGSLALAILLGIALGNSGYPALAPVAAKGVDFSRQNLLRLGIVLYGFRLTFQDLAKVGVSGVAIDLLVLCTTFALALFVGIKLLKLDCETVLLIGAGSSICGAAAVMASAPVVRARAEQVAVAVSTIVVFGTLAIFVYPALFRTHCALFGASPAQFGVYAGSTIHEVAQVLAAGRSINAQVADTAVLAKMVRVMMLAPFLLMLSVWLARAKSYQATQTESRMPITVPWFAFAFIGMVAVNSLVVLPASIKALLQDGDTMLLAMAMAALGLTTHVSAVKRAGLKPLLLAAVLFAWVIFGGAAINYAVVEL